MHFPRGGPLCKRSPRVLFCLIFQRSEETVTGGLEGESATETERRRQPIPATMVLDKEDGRCGGVRSGGWVPKREGGRDGGSPAPPVPSVDLLRSRIVREQTSFGEEERLVCSWRRACGRGAFLQSAPSVPSSTVQISALCVCVRIGRRSPIANADSHDLLADPPPPAALHIFSC